MKFAPKRIIHSKLHKKSSVLVKLKKVNLVYRPYAITAASHGIVTEPQMEVLRRILVKQTQKKIKMLRRVGLTCSLTKKPLHSRMGKGCGKFRSWIGYVYTSKVLFELKLKKKHKNIQIPTQVLPIKINIFKINTKFRSII